MFQFLKIDYFFIYYIIIKQLTKMLHIFALFIFLLYFDFNDKIILTIAFFVSISLILYGGVPFWALGI
jgi:hypothetical protein